MVITQHSLSQTQGFNTCLPLTTLFKTALPWTSGEESRKSLQERKKGLYISLLTPKKTGGMRPILDLCSTCTLWSNLFTFGQSVVCRNACVPAIGSLSSNWETHIFTFPIISRHWKLLCFPFQRVKNNQLPFGYFLAFFTSVRTQPLLRKRIRVLVCLDNPQHSGNCTASCHY